ncbi:chorismate mutase [Gracilibacillus halophilus YIM-C55.5]|uniref:chorismate mutase n=1 Tax=Gracilibacillus halophilus YIM-C55.5 TaxID=1308866 RepID=N4WW73_9BACI|nr:chorismate mutase [Gracilibacillus halophilus]ENH97336.1 chorismate mutase [Gracilibacillus halophilus YIM-C55.5]
MIRGIRGAVTVTENHAEDMIQETKRLIETMAEKNQIAPEDIASVFISITNDLNATFPAKALRLIDGWKYVPVMCMPEIDVPGGLEKCIRVMMTVNTSLGQKDVNHIYLNDAIQLRPDLMKEE